MQLLEWQAARTSLPVIRKSKTQHTLSFFFFLYLIQSAHKLTQPLVSLGYKLVKGVDLDQIL